MTEELQQRTAALLDYLEIAIRGTTDFAIEQVPEVVHQLLLWHFTISLIWFSVAIVSIIVIVILTYKAVKFAVHEKSEELATVALTMAVLVTLVPLILIVENMDWLQIWIAPKLYLLEYASSLLK